MRDTLHSALPSPDDLQCEKTPRLFPGWASQQCVIPQPALPTWGFLVLPVRVPDDLQCTKRHQGSFLRWRLVRALHHTALTRQPPPLHTQTCGRLNEGGDCTLCSCLHQQIELISRHNGIRPAPPPNSRVHSPVMGSSAGAGPLPSGAGPGYARGRTPDPRTSQSFPHVCVVGSN